MPSWESPFVAVCGRAAIKLALCTIELIREPILVELKNYTAGADMRYRAPAAWVLYYYTRREAQRVANCEAVNRQDFVGSMNGCRLDEDKEQEVLYRLRLP